MHHRLRTHFGVYANQNQSALIILENSGILTSRKINQWAFYQIKDEVFDIVKQLLQWVSRDPIMQQDQQIFKNMYSNRELSLNKLNIKPLNIS